MPQELNINTTGINPAYMKLPTHGIPGYETIYVECDCSEDERKTLFENLKCSPSNHDAINIELHDDQQGIRLYNDYKFYIIMFIQILIDYTA